MIDTKKVLKKWFYILLVAVPIGLIFFKLKPVFIMGWAGFFLLIAIVLFVHADSPNKEAKKYLIFAACACLLLTILYSKSYHSSKKKEKDSQSQIEIQTVPTAPTVWYEDIEVTGKEVEGKIVFVPEASWYKVDYTSGGIYDTPEAKIRGDYDKIWGTDYDREWKKYFIYSNIPGVKAMEALVIVDGEVGSETGKICQFPDGKMSFRIWVEKYVRFFRHEPFRPDINGNRYHCFQNNYGAWKFRISKVAD